MTVSYRAEVKFSELDPASAETVFNSDILPIVNSGNSKKITLGSIRSYLVNSGVAETSVVNSYVDNAVTNAIENLVSGAPSYLDTLKELADAINSDANFSGTVQNLIAQSFTGRTTDDLNEGTINRYYTEGIADARWDWKLSQSTTTNLAEGSNLYFTNERVLALVNPMLTGISYNDLTDKPTDPTYNSVTTELLNVKDIDFTGTGAVNIRSGNDLNLIAVGNIYANGSKLFSGNYDDLENKPDIFPGDYNLLINKPTLFSGNYDDLFNKPVFFSGSYNDLTDKPADPIYNSVTLNNPIINSNQAATKGYVDSQVSNAANLLSTDDLPEGGVNKYYLDSRARNSISVSGNALMYNSSTGVITYTAPNLAAVATTGSYMDLLHTPVLFSGSYTDLTNKPTLFSGSYTDLTNKPNFATVATSGSYTDLTNKPTLFSGDYNALTNKPTLFSGDYNALTNKPTLFSGSYADLTNKPSLATVATSGSYTDLTNKPTIPSAYTLPTASTSTLGGVKIDGTSILISSGIIGVTSTPTFTSVTATDINVKNLNYTGTGPVTITSNNDLNLVATGHIYANGAILFSGSYADLTNKPTLFSGAYADLTGKPSLAAVATTGSYNSLTNKPTLFSGSYADLTNKPTLFSGSYADLTNKPNLSVYATEIFVNNKVADLVSSSPAALDTLNELSTALGNDPNFATTITNLIGSKANVDSLAAVATSGSYEDLINRPELFSGNYTDLTNKPDLSIYSTFSGSYYDLTDKPTLFSGSYADLTDKPTLFSGSYTDLTNKPTLFSGAYADLIGKPTIVTDIYQLSDSHHLLTGTDPTFNSATITDLNVKNVSFTGTGAVNIRSGNDLNLIATGNIYANGKTLFSGAYADLTGKPNLFSGDYNALTNKPILFNGSYNSLTDKPNLFSGDYNALTNKPTLFSGAYADLTGKPETFDGNYNNLTNKPTIPTDINQLTDSNGLLGVSTIGDNPVFNTVTISSPVINPFQAATKSYVDSQVSSVQTLLSSDDLPEGSVNMYFSVAKARAAIVGGNGISYNPSTGVISATGSSGSSSAASVFVFNQMSPENVWTVRHNLGQKYVIVDVTDIHDVTLTGGYDYPTVQFIDDRTLTITFSYPATGHAIIATGSCSVTVGGGAWDVEAWDAVPWDAANETFVTKSELKSVVAASTSFEDFKNRIAAL